MYTSIIAGSSGLVGNNILNQLCENNHNVIAINRKEVLGLPSKANELVIDFESFLIDGVLPACDHIFLCLGTKIILEELILTILLVLQKKRSNQVLKN